MYRTKFTLLIPCLNERDTIKQAAEDAKENCEKYLSKNYEIIVADNGSTDGTLNILKKIDGIKIINVPVKGYGAALHWGIMKAKGKYIIFADADLSYPFTNIKGFIFQEKFNPDLVLGSRIKGNLEKGAMPFLHRYLGTPILTFLIRLLYGIPTTDSNSGMRMVKKSFYKKLNMRCSGMEWASELLLKTALNNGKYIEVPILFKKDKRTKSPHLSTWPDGWRHLKSILLLKPSSLYILLIIFPVLALISYINKSFGFTFLFMNLTVVLFLSLIVLNLLSAAINGKPTKLSTFLVKFRLVPITILFFLFVGLIILFIPDTHLGTKLFLVSILGIIFMWIFLVETIKTHLISRLPDV